MQMPPRIEEMAHDGVTLAEVPVPQAWVDGLGVEAPFDLRCSQLHCLRASQVWHLGNAPERDVPNIPDLVRWVADAGLDRKVCVEGGVVIGVQRCSDTLWWVWSARLDATSLETPLRWARERVRDVTATAA